MPEVQGTFAWELESRYGRLLGREHAGDLSRNLIRFCATLRERGFKVGIGETVEALRALALTDLTDWREFYLVLRTLLVSRFDQLTTFDALFHSFWTGWGGTHHLAHQLFDAPREGWTQGRPTHGTRIHSQVLPGDAAEDTDEQTGLALYSAEEAHTCRIFPQVQREELRQFGLLVRLLGRRLASAPGRRTRIERKGRRIDLRRTLRRSLPFGGEILLLARKNRSLQRLRLVLLLDVSRSMDVYSLLLLKLAYCLQGLRGRTESFVFGTDLKRVTPWFRSGDINAALAGLSSRVPFWSGGTRIGHSLRLFCLKYGHKLLTNRTVVLVVSDGLDTEEADLVSDALAEIKQKIAKLVWINPLLETPGYEPLARSMAAAMPYIDLFTSAERLLASPGVGNASRR